MSAFYFLAGVNHFWHPGFYLRIMPDWIGSPELFVTISGIAEIVLAILLLPFGTRRFAAWGMMVLLIAIFPANIQMMQDHLKEQHPGTWITIVRLPVQVLLIWWAYTVSKNKVKLYRGSMNY